MAIIEISDREFLLFQKIIYGEVGIDLPITKKMLVQTRLLKRIQHYEFKTYSEYLRLVQINKEEKIEMINLITTNETYFFREIEHYEYLKDKIIPQASLREKFRFWSAASSVGAEAYSAAMILDTHFSRNNWEVFGTDINTDVIHKARMGLYPESWSQKIPLELKKKYCLKGKGSNLGRFLIDRILIDNIQFKQKNLLVPVDDIGVFDVIFLRNVLIYFDDNTKKTVVDNVIKNLKIGGYFFISFTENLNMIKVDELKQVAPSIFKKIS